MQTELRGRAKLESAARGRPRGITVMKKVDLERVLDDWGATQECSDIHKDSDVSSHSECFMSAKECRAKTLMSR